jgi:hypothetical protein
MEEMDDLDEEYDRMERGNDEHLWIARCTIQGAKRSGERWHSAPLKQMQPDRRSAPMGPKLNIVVLLAFLVGGMLWIERGHRVVIEPPQLKEHHPCPDSDAMPYTARCIEFMLGSNFQNRPLSISK